MDIIEIEYLSRDVTSLINKGLEIQSERPYYFYSKSIYFWNLIILQTIMGFASATFFGPAMADISNFFKKQRGFALSIVASANYVAGATWPLLIFQLMENLGNMQICYKYLAERVLNVFNAGP